MGILGANGAFAERICVPVANLHAVPDGVPDEAAVFVEPLAAAFEILEQVRVDASTRALVFGDGKLGQLIWRVIATTGCDLTLIGKHAGKLELAARAGIKTTELGALEIAPASRFDFVVEASGSAGGLRLALDLARPRGAVILKSTFHGAVELDASRIVVNEISVIVRSPSCRVLTTDHA